MNSSFQGYCKSGGKPIMFHYYCNGKYHKNWGSLQQKTENQDSSINEELREPSQASGAPYVRKMR